MLITCVSNFSKLFQSVSIQSICSARAGLANSKTVHIESAEEGAVAVTVTRPKNISKPLHAKSKNVTRKPIRQAQASLAKQMDRSRPDLKVRLVCELAVNRSNDVSKRKCVSLSCRKQPWRASAPLTRAIESLLRQNSPLLESVRFSL